MARQKHSCVTCDLLYLTHLLNLWRPRVADPQLQRPQMQHAHIASALDVTFLPFLPGRSRTRSCSDARSSMRGRNAGGCRPHTRSRAVPRRSARWLAPQARVKAPDGQKGLKHALDNEQMLTGRLKGPLTSLPLQRRAIRLAGRLCERLCAGCPPGQKACHMGDSGQKSKGDRVLCSLAPHCSARLRVLQVRSLPFW